MLWTKSAPGALTRIASASELEFRRRLQSNFIALKLNLVRGKWAIWIGASFVAVAAAGPSATARIGDNEQPSCKGQAATLVGSQSADELRGTNGDDVIVARAGQDEVRSRGGEDLVCSGPERDDVYGGTGADRLLGGSARDLLIGGGDDDVMRGGPAIDDLYGANRKGNSPDDVCAGGAPWGDNDSQGNPPQPTGDFAHEPSCDRVRSAWAGVRIGFD